jgi:hypothetical protein
MEYVKLKINAKAWVGLFIFFYVFSSGLLFYLVETHNQLTLLGTAFVASVMVVGSTTGIFYFFQKEVILTDNEIKKIGFPSKSIAYNDIQKIRVGKESGGQIDGYQCTRVFICFHQVIYFMLDLIILTTRFHSP